MGWIIFIIIVVVVIGIAMAVADVQAGSKNIEALASIPNFRPVATYGGGMTRPGVAIDPTSEKFAITRPGGSPCLYSFDQLVAVEVERNGSSIQKTNRGSQVAGAAVGAVLLGPVGLLLGGLTGTKRNIEKMKRLSLKIYTNDLASPVTELVFFSDSNGANPDGFAVTQAAQELDAWYGRFQTILHMRSRGTADS